MCGVASGVQMGHCEEGKGSEVGRLLEKAHDDVVNGAVLSAAAESLSLLPFIQC